jgi:hypothetical protein
MLGLEVKARGGYTPERIPSGRARWSAQTSSQRRQPRAAFKIGKRM